MRACVPNRVGLKRVAIAMPLTVFQFDLIDIVASLESSREGSKLNPVRLASVPMCLFDLPNHARIHRAPPLLDQRRTVSPIAIGSRRRQRLKRINTARSPASVLHLNPWLSGQHHSLPSTPLVRSRVSGSVSGSLTQYLNKSFVFAPSPVRHDATYSWSG